MSPLKSNSNSKAAFLFGAPATGFLAEIRRGPNTFAERDNRRRDSDIVQDSDGFFVWKAPRRFLALILIGFVVGHIVIPMVTTTYVDVGRARQERTQGENHGR